MGKHLFKQAISLLAAVCMIANMMAVSIAALEEQPTAPQQQEATSMITIADVKSLEVGSTAKVTGKVTKVEVHTVNIVDSTNEELPIIYPEGAALPEVEQTITVDIVVTDNNGSKQFKLAASPKAEPEEQAGTFSGIITKIDGLKVTAQSEEKSIVIVFKDPLPSMNIGDSISVKNTADENGNIVLENNEDAVISPQLAKENAKTIAEIRAAYEKDKPAVVTGIVTAVDTRNVYVQDQTAAIVVYYKDKNNAPKVGDRIIASGNYGEYKGLMELILNDDANANVVESGQPLPEPKEITLADLLKNTENYESQRILIKNVVVNSINLTGNSEISQGTSKINIYKIPTIENLKVGDNVNVIATVSQFTAYQLRVWNAAEITIAVPHIVISEVYGGGGNSGATIKNDFIELYNPSSVDVSLNGWSIQRTSKTGKSYSDIHILTANDTIAAGKYFLLKCAAGTTGAEITDFDAVVAKGFLMGKDSNKVALVRNSEAITSSSDEDVEDFVGYGGADESEVKAGPATENTTSIQRKDNSGGNSGVTNGWDTDNNENDFYTATPTPRSSKTPVTDIPVVTLAETYEGEYGNDMPAYIKASSKESTIEAIEYALKYNDTDALHWENANITKGEKSVEATVNIKLLPKSDNDIPRLVVKAKNAIGNYSEPIEKNIFISKLPYIAECKPTGINKTSPTQLSVTIETFSEQTKYDIAVYLVDDPKTPVEILKQNEVKDKTITGNFSQSFADGLHKLKVDIKDKSREGHTYSMSKEWTFIVGNVTYIPYFGQLHSHTKESDGEGTLDEAFAWARTEAKLDFFAVTDHSNNYITSGSNEEQFKKCLEAKTVDETKNDKWKLQNEKSNSYNKDGEFVAITGYEMTWNNSTSKNPLNGIAHGHMNTFNTEWFASREDPNMQDLVKYYDKIASDKGSINQFNHPGTQFGTFKEFGHYNKAYDDAISLIEVGNGEGPIRGTGYFPSYKEYIKALDKGWHVSPTNNQDNHRKGWGTANTGRTVVLSEALTREAILNGMREGHVYATEDSNLSISFEGNGMVMGSILDDPKTINMSVKINDPDKENMTLTVLTNGGKTVESKKITDGTADWKFDLKADNAYYLLRVDQADKDIAVTAPIYTGKKVQTGITDISFSEILADLNQKVKLNVSMYHNDLTKKAVVDKIEVRKGSTDGELVLSNEINKPISSNYIESFDITADTLGINKYFVTVNVTIDGVQTVFTKDLSLRVQRKDRSIRAMVDASHRNSYVSGYYNGKTTALNKLLNNMGIFVEYNTNDFSDDALKDIDLLLISDPCTRKTTDADNDKITYSDAEIAAIKKYSDNGGALIVTSNNDFFDPGKGDTKNVTYPGKDGPWSADYQVNQILKALGSCIRANDDEVFQNKDDKYRLYYDDYGLSEKYLLTQNIGTTIDKGNTVKKTYSSYAGGSLYFADDADTSKAEVIVKMHEDCGQDDADGNGDMIPKTASQMFSMAAEILPNGSKLIAAGSLFCSDFEIDGTAADMYSNSVILDNIVKWMLMRKEQTTIKQVHQNADEWMQMGKVIEVKGRVTAQPVGTSRSLGTDNSFFDVMYIQDETAGITVFGVSNRNIPLGTEVLVKGTIEKFNDDTEIQLSDENKDIIVLSSPVETIAPKPFKTGEIIKQNMGWLASVTGKVTRIEGQDIFLNDTSGEARVYVEGYIGSSTKQYEKGKWNSSIKVGSNITAAGLISCDTSGMRIRVRDTDEISLSAVKEVTIYHTNDMHGKVASATAKDKNGNTYLTTIGADVLATLKKDTPNSILLDVGDATQGSSMATLTKGEDIIRIMNAAGYDVMAAGNHEFDYGLDQFLNNARAANFPILSANAVKDGKPILKDLTYGANKKNNGATFIKEISGMKIGFFGITSPETAFKTNPELLKGTSFGSDTVEAVEAVCREQITALEKEGANVIIGLMHIGVDSTSNVTSRKLAEKLKDTKLNVILDGHSHSNVSEKIGNITVAQVGTGSANLGKLVIELNGGTINITSTVMSASSLTSTKSDTDVANLINTIIDNQKEKLAPVVGKTKAPLWGGTINGVNVARIGETNMGNLVADSMVYGAKKLITDPNIKSLPIVALQNGGGVRAIIKAGDITRGDVLNVLPFGNCLSFKIITPDILYKAIENGVSLANQNPDTGENSKPNGAFPQISGMRVEYNPDAAVNSRVIAIYLDGAKEPLDKLDSKTQIVFACNDFTIAGGDNYTMLKGIPSVGEGGVLDEMLAEYIKELTKSNSGGFYYAPSTGRIKAVGKYVPKPYAAKLTLKKADGSILANTTIGYKIDLGSIISAKTNENGILTIEKLEAGPHCITIQNTDGVLVDNYAGLGTSREVTVMGASEYVPETQGSTGGSGSNVISGFDISKQITSSEEDTTIIDITGSNYYVGASFFETLMNNRNECVILDGGWYQWVFNGKEINKLIPGLIYFDSRINTSSPNEDAIKKLIGNAVITHLFFNYDGILPGKTIIRIKLDKLPGNNLFIYYFNPKLNRLERMASNVKPDKDGWVSFAITHCSDFVISKTAIPAVPYVAGNPNTGGTYGIGLDGTINIGPITSDRNIQPSAIRKTNTDETESSGPVPLIAVSLIVIMPIAIAATYYLRSKKEETSK